MMKVYFCRTNLKAISNSNDGFSEVKLGIKFLKFKIKRPFKI